MQHRVIPRATLGGSLEKVPSLFQLCLFVKESSGSFWQWNEGGTLRSRSSASTIGAQVAAPQS